MAIEFDPKADSRSVEELVNIALSEVDEELVWQAIAALHWKGTRDVLQRAEALCCSQCARERCQGAQILGQLGVPDRTFPVECSRRLQNMLKVDERAEVLEAALVGLSFQHDVEAVPLIVTFSTHVDAEVRNAVVMALLSYEAPLAIECLIALSRDSDPHVRDWATFGLGTQINLDTPEIRAALADRLDDPDDATRWEALVGLELRQTKEQSR